MARIIPLISPKQDTGKTFVSIHLAHALASKGHGVCLLATGWELDAEGAWFDKRLPGDLKDVLSGRKQLQEVIGSTGGGLQVIADSDGLKAAADGKAEDLPLVTEMLSATEGCDYLVVDSPAGVSQRAMAFCLTVQEAVLVLTLDSQCLTAAFDLLRALAANGFKGTVKTVFNQVRNISMARKAFSKFQESTRRYLELSLEMLAIIHYDSKARQASRDRRLLPNAKASRAFSDILEMAMAIDQEVPTDRQALPMGEFWEGFLDNMRCLLPQPAQVARRIARAPAAGPKPAGVAKAAEAKERSASDALEKIAAALEQLVREIQALRRQLDSLAGQGPHDRAPQFHQPLRLDWEAFVNNRSQD